MVNHSKKRIRDTIDKPYYDKMHERLKTPYAKKMKKLRQSTVEPVLGTLINFLAMKRVNTRGIKLANKCMLMAGITYNIKKIMKFKTSRPTTAVAWLSRESNHFINSLFFFPDFFFSTFYNPKSKISIRLPRLFDICNYYKCRTGFVFHVINLGVDLNFAFG